MTGKPRSVDGDQLDEAAIGRLVRDAAESWAMPAVRLDAPAWRDRVRGRRARRVDGLRASLGRLGQAATAAVALTVVGALVAVLLTRAPSTATSSPGPSGKASPGPSAAQPSALPKLVLGGELPSPSRVVAWRDGGDFGVVDLATGTLGASLGRADYGSQLHVKPDGSVVCLCLTLSGSAHGSPTNASVAVVTYDASGAETARVAIDAFSGAPDPRDEGVAIPDQPANVLTQLSISPDGRIGYVGWSARAHPAWKSGVVAVDLETLQVVGRVDLPDVGDGDGAARVVVDAPRVVGAAGEASVIGRSRYVFEPVTSSNPAYTFGVDGFAAPLGAGSGAGATSLPGASGCGQQIRRGGGIAGGGYWLACGDGDHGATIIRSLDAAGAATGDDTSVPTGSGIDADPTAVSPDGTALFLWNPVDLTLSRVDVATRAIRSQGVSGTAARVPGPLAALGSWLAPTAAAKSFLVGGVIVSPDGQRVYAIGIKPGATERDPSGSTGVYVFDAATAAEIGHWAPPADFVSIAVSRDGRFLYAAGLPGVAPDGQDRARQGASITVFDASDGSVRLIAGDLGSRLLTFPGVALG